MKRNLINKELWLYVIATLRYLPKTIITLQVDGLLFYSPQKQTEIRRRMQGLSPI
ncbi:hypothetical protein J3L18_04640 [Mucilaginibacter gossypii]|uniref:hypothetical protein n=1 Tax=Mucilaginibacter gossypii TaxID=551996 RepID=UPI00167A3779|nr:MULTISPECIES: hypothetical protein [Mucilaginibacter]QTE38370.1 hypothetical protein J3L18_04640 [Mucilaginibacter gossypii]